jgi:protein gp37
MVRRYFTVRRADRVLLTKEEVRMVELTVNGQIVPLNRFVATLLEAQLIATVNSLRDIPGAITRISLTVVPEEE